MRISRIFISILAVLLVASGIMLASAQDDAAKPYLGVTIRPADDGAEVVRVQPGSPAATAGLLPGDIIRAINDEGVDADTLAAAISALNVGDEVSLDVLRNDDNVQLTATLGEQPQQPARPGRGSARPSIEFPTQRAWLGVSLQAADGGVSIAAVSEGSPAATAGLQVGDVINAVNGKAVAEPADVAAAIRNLAIGDSVTLSITRDGETQDVTATLGSMMSQMHSMLGDIIMYDGESWRVISLSEDNPLAAAGVQAGDVITAIDGGVYDPAGLADYLSGLAEDAAVTLTIDRAGETVEVTANAADLNTLNSFGFGFGFGRRGEGFGIPDFEFRIPRGGQFNFMPGSVRLGVAYTDLNADVAAEHNLDVTEGALITEVMADSPAAEAGLQVDDVITAVEGDRVDARRTLRERLLAYDPGDTVTLEVLRGGETLSIDVTLAEVSMPDMMNRMPFDLGDGFRFFFGPDGRLPMPQIPQQPQAPAANL
jgi:S1-C subfamily serine protease